MHTLGKLTIYLGVLLVAAGLLVGFGALFAGADATAVPWLGAIPVGFVALLLGTVMTQLSEPSKQHDAE